MTAGVLLGAGVVKREARMADGRTLAYFDDPGTTLTADRPLDRRDLPPRPPVATMRQDVLTGEWISIAAARQQRVVLPPADLDPLAPQTANNPSEVPGDYDVVAFENRSPSFAFDSSVTAGDVAGIGLGRTLPSAGRCEVLCFSPSTTGSLGGQSPTRIRTIVEAWADRTAALSASPGVAQVFPFENRGEAIGVTLHHPHGQIYGYPYVTPRTSSLLRSIDTYGPTLMADVLDRERNGERVVLAGTHFTAFVPFAARWPIELHVLAHRQVPDLALTTQEERDELAVFVKTLLSAIDRLYETPTPYIAAWHQAPVREGRDVVRLMWQITSPRRGADRMKYLAGSESAMGAFIGDVAPEAQAAQWREAVAAVQESATVEDPEGAA